MKKFKDLKIGDIVFIDFELIVDKDNIGHECSNCGLCNFCDSLNIEGLLCNIIGEGLGLAKDGALFKKIDNQKQKDRKFDTKFNVGDTVFFLNNKQIYKGVVSNIKINIDSCVLETYKVSFIDKDDYCENCKKIGDFDVDELFESAKHLVDKLMLDFENSDKENEETAKKEI